MTNERTNRAFKAIAITNALAAAGCDAETARNLDAQGWQLAAKVAAATVAEATGNDHAWTDASAATQAIVVRLLVDRETTSDADLFDAFPSTARATTDAQLAHAIATEDADYAEAATWPAAQPAVAPDPTYTNGDPVTVTVTDDGVMSQLPAVYVRPSSEHQAWHQVRLCSTGQSVMVSAAALARFLPTTVEQRRGEPGWVVVTERAVQSSRPWAGDQKALGAAVRAATARRVQEDTTPAAGPQGAPEGLCYLDGVHYDGCGHDPAFLNWCETHDEDPDGPRSTGLYQDWLDDNDREGLRR